MGAPPIDQPSTGAVAAKASIALGGRGLLGRVPRATYRLQLRSDFGLDAVLQHLPYLHALGISDVYLSPLFKARDESSHGYDVVDHSKIDPAFGTLADFQALAEAVAELGMGILLDVPPNHMGINDPANAWWVDVLERGEESAYASYFDIDWEPAAPQLHHKVLLPFLGAPFGEILESGQLRVVWERERLQLAYGDKQYPLARSTWPAVLAELLRDTSADEQAVARALAELNGQPGEPRSFDALEALLDAQCYRLAYWRVAADEINYRRFFDINDLAAIRVEDQQVFDAVHQLVAEFLRDGWIAGLRIDHPDGLLDPETYFERLQTLYRNTRDDGNADAPGELYLVAEKILSGDEELPADWAVSGTTGYEFLSVVSRLLVHPEGLAKLRQSYERLTGESQSAAEVAYQSKREVLRNSLASEVNMLASQLDRIARQHRSSRDFTRPALERALREVIACLPVYRTYVHPRGWEISEADYRHVTHAVRWAKRRNPGASHAEFDFIAGVLRLENPTTLSLEQADLRRQFTLKVQQVTGPATAKGLEDTAFYRYYPLASLNEVGGELAARPLEPDEFHRLMVRRALDWPHSLSATGTHDTKRGEDFRARLHVLSEIADEWAATVERWQELTRPLLATVDGEPAPDRNELLLLFQTLVGVWPVDPMDPRQTEELATRVAAYMQKALREAKRRTSWMNPDPEFEAAIAAFVRTLIIDDAGAAFRAELEPLVRKIAPAGFINGLSQLLLKITLPGVPDMYQGSECWDFNLVDPDNRRPVDFERRRHTLDDLQRRFREAPTGLAAQLAAMSFGDATKQFVAWRGLATRAAFADVFRQGNYQPLSVAGSASEHLFAFARSFGDQWIAVVVPRQIQCLLGANCAIDWQDAAVELPPSPHGWRNEFTGEPVSSITDGRVRAAELLAPLPIALLSSLHD